MACFALAHMSCAGAWAWGEVPDRLRAAGHAVAAPDLSRAAGATPATHAEQLVRAAGAATEVVVAGHSYGGVVALAAAGRLGGRARALALVDAILVDDGESAFDARPVSAAARRAEAARRGDGMWTAGEPEPDRPDWAQRLVPFPLSAMQAPVTLSPAAGRLPRLYVLCEHGDMHDQAERARERGWRVERVPASHALPLDDPQRCAELLLSVLA